MANQWNLILRSTKLKASNYIFFVHRNFWLVEIEKARSVIVVDHQMVIDCINLMIEEKPDFITVGETIQPLPILELLSHTHGDIIITDVGMLGVSGVELSRAVKN